MERLGGINKAMILLLYCETSRETIINHLKTEQRYYFKMCAVTSMGQGKFTKVRSVIIDPSGVEPDGGRLGIILGAVIGGGCIIMCLIVLLCIFCRPCNLCRRSRGSQRLPSNSSAHQGNGFGPISNHFITSRDIDSNQPMLYENHIDSKGGKSPPVSRVPCNGYATRTHYMPNGNVRTILAESNKPQETSFGPDNSQVPLTSICESLETADTGYSEPREFDPDTLDSCSDDDVNVNNTSILLPGDKGSSQDILQSGCSPLNSGQPSPHVSLIIKNSSSENDDNKQDHPQPQVFNNRSVGDDCNDGGLNNVTDSCRFSDSLTQQEKPLLPDNHHHYHLFNDNSNHLSGLHAGVPFTPQRVHHQGMHRQQSEEEMEDDFNESCLNYTGEEKDYCSENKDESDDDYVKLAVAAPNQNTSVAGEEGRVIIKKQPTSGLLPSASSPNPFPTPSITSSCKGNVDVGNNESGGSSNERVAKESSSPISTQQITSVDDSGKCDPATNNILINNNSSSADNNKLDSTPQKPQFDLKEVRSPPAPKDYHTINPIPSTGQEHGNGYDPILNNSLDKDSGREEQKIVRKNGFVMNGNCLNGVKAQHNHNGQTLGGIANGVLSDVDMDSSCGKGPIMNGHVATIHQDNTLKGTEPRVNIDSAHKGQASLNVIA